MEVRPIYIAVHLLSLSQVKEKYIYLLFESALMNGIVVFIIATIQYAMAFRK